MLFPSVRAFGQAAGQQPLDIRPGLWEYSVRTSSVMPSATTIKPDIPPNYNAQQRAQYLAAVAAAQKAAEEVAAKGTNTKTKLCLSRSDIDSAKLFGDISSCPRLEMSSSAQKVTIKCPRYPGSQDKQDSYVFDRIDSGNYKGTARLEINLTDRTDEFIVGHWLGESCKPSAAKPASATPSATAGTTAPSTDKAAATALPADAQLRRLGNDYKGFVVNHGTSALTAYVLLVAHYGNSQLNRHFYDLRMLDYPPIKPGASHLEDFPGIITGVKMIGGVFADGSSYGDQKVVADLMERRNVKLKAFAEIVSNLCQSQRAGLDAKTASSSLEKAEASAAKSGTSMDIAIVNGTYTDSIRILGQQSVKSPGAAIPSTLDKIREWTTGLMADPVRDSSGNLFVTATPAQFTCR
jgi:hypothetical protein